MMTKIKLTTKQDFDTLLLELNEDTDTEVNFENENIPLSFPCIAVHHYADDSDFGSCYDVTFVYPSDFNLSS